MSFYLSSVLAMVISIALILLSNRLSSTEYFQTTNGLILAFIFACLVIPGLGFLLLIAATALFVGAISSGSGKLSDFFNRVPFGRK